MELVPVGAAGHPGTAAKAELSAAAATAGQPGGPGLALSRRGEAKRGDAGGGGQRVSVVRAGVRDPAAGRPGGPPI